MKTEGKKFIQFTILIFAVVAILGALSPAFAQTRPAMVRSVDEPARVPYSYSVQPVYTAGNEAMYPFPVVPAGKRLRLTNVRAVFVDTDVPAFFAVCKNSDAHILMISPLTPFDAAFHGTLLSINQDVDLIFEAGEAPVLQLGVTWVSNVAHNVRNRFGVTGYLVDLLP